MVKTEMHLSAYTCRPNLHRGEIWIAVALVLFTLGATAATHAGDPRFQLVFSQSMFTEVNESDARAAMKVWITTVANERGLMVDNDPVIPRTMDELSKACRSAQTGGCAITLPEYAHLIREIDFDHFAVGIVNGVFTDEYLLLTRQGSGLERLDQLQGRRLAVLNNPRMSLALIWLDTLLLEARLEPAGVWFGAITLNKSAAQTALPVFFGKVDACVLTRSSFEVMAELNPQLEQQLRLVAVSAPLVPSGFAYRMDAADSFMTSMIDAMEQLRESPAGLQILQLLQAERIENHSVAVLDPSLALLDRYQRLRADAGSGETQ